MKGNSKKKMEISRCHNDYNYNKKYANELECFHLR